MNIAMYAISPNQPELSFLDDRASCIPAYLRNTPWPAYKTQVLSNLLPELRQAITKLTKKVSTERVHSTRVVLRRWQVATKVIEIEGSDWSHYQALNGKLNKLRKALGTLRDCEILLELAKDLKLSKTVITGFKKEKQFLLAKVKKRLAQKNVAPVFKRFDRLIKRRKLDLVMLNDKSTSGSMSAYQHLEPLLCQLELQAQDLEAVAHSAEELHELRITIKTWRYVLTEFFGLTNLQLVKAQQVLGKLHDLDRLSEVLKESKYLSGLDNDTLERIAQLREYLLSDFAKLRENLPYELRPSVKSTNVKLSRTRRG